MLNKRFITTFTTLLILLLNGGCGSDSNIVNTETTSSDETISDNLVLAAEPTETYSHIEDDTTEVPTETKSLTWQKAYLDYMESFWENNEPYTYFGFSLIYLDDDDIPELFINTGSEAGGEIVATYFNGQLQSEQLSRIGSIYIERSGLIYCDTGHMGQYPVYIKKLKHGEFSDIGSGVRSYRISEDENTISMYVLDENDNPIMDYRWEGETVSEEAFYENIDSLFNREKGIYPKRFYSAEEMISILKTGQHTSAGHRYELIQENITWEEAQEFCKEKGGYLATITSPDEQDAIAAQIAEEEKQDISFYVGYRNCEWVGDEFLSARWINADGSFTDAEHLYNFSEYSAPDYDSRQSKEWDIDHDDCGLVKYYDSVKQIYLFAAPEDLLEISPEYSGKMGYICEFDE